MSWLGAKAIKVPWRSEILSWLGAKAIKVPWRSENLSWPGAKAIKVPWRSGDTELKYKKNSDETVNKETSHRYFY
ncbi:hypothetical protein [Cohnella sp. WQ 127256]|uniref:hypothetical protein n=1 Tax=Cohnella sp. WQ 127256 TaxID=2938790 RepID=UPI0021174032|nr:hypothetical protein [Cohnella sp. WQ 127256]